MLAHVDHIVYAVEDLDSGIACIEHQLGIRPVLGGKHKAWGTHNAILSLGDAVYLEVIAPDPELTPPPSGPPSVFRALGAGRITTWAAKSRDIAKTHTLANRAGIHLGETVNGSRMRDDGTKLNWSLTNPFTVVMDGLVPFFIDWGDSIHPSVHAPRGCRLIRLGAESPTPDELRKVFLDLNVPIEVHEGPVPALFAQIDTPTGEVTIR